MSQQKPGWVNVPGKGRRYWTGSEYRFYGPSDDPARGGGNAISLDIGGYWNNFVNQYGRSTKDPKQVGAQSFTTQQVKDSKKPTEQKPAAPAQPAEKSTPPKGKGDVPNYTVTGVTYDGNTGRPVDAPEGGYSLEPSGSMTPHSTERTNPNGITQKGLTLGGINGLFASLNSSGKITEGELPSASKFFSEALPTTEAGAEQQGHGSLVTGPDGKPMEEEDHVWNDQTGRLEPPTAPGTTGGKPDNAEDGTSDKPDVAENIRQVRMRRKGPRDDGGPRGFQIDRANEMAQNSVSETKGNGMSKERMAARSAFLDEGNKGYAAIRARDRAVGAFDQNGTGGMRIDDEFVQFNPGMSADARYELAGGKVQSKDDAKAFLEKYTQKLAKPEEEEK